MKPSAIFSFDMDGPAMARGSSAEREGCELYSLGGISSTLGNRYNASDLRALSILSYFHTNSTPSPHSSSTRFWDTILPLCAQPPWEVDLSCAAVDKIVLVGSGAEDVIEDELFRALNGSLVGLIAYDDGNNNNDDRSSADSSQEMARYSPGGTPPDPSSSRCLGLALIRSISPHPRTSPLLHILTPVPPTVLAKSRILVKGELELPIWGMLDFREDEEEKGTIGGVEYGVVPFLQWGAGRGVGGVPRRVRRNLMRRGQT